MNKENERVTYEEFMTMFKFAPRMCYTLYEKAEDEIEKLQKENQQLKKQKSDVVEYIKNYLQFRKEFDLDKLLRMLGETDD